MESKRLTACLAMLTLAALACTAPGAATSAAETPLMAETVVLTATPPPATMIPPNRPSPTPLLPTVLPPSFAPVITFAETPDISQGLREFHAGVTQIYALWQYSNMTDGLVVRRDWYLDGELWITRTEPWDFARYGASGIVTDISIHDLQNGLTSGHYELRLYIDDMPQFGPADDVSLRSFDIAPAADGEA